jgi:D-alanyl-D-alanine carboxypeptidase (penicillin-binding protein 5/6)
LKARAQETARLIEWAFREFRPYRLFGPGETIAEADVWLGVEDTVPLTVERGATVILSRAARRGMTATLVYDTPLEAPVAKGERVAKLVVTAPGAATAEFPVLAGEDVDELSGLPRALAAAGELLEDWSDDLFPMPRDTKTSPSPPG